MNERLKQFLAMESLTPARFADVMGIQRSGISHLLAGRNKPSFEFIQKMLTAYPNLNPEWLILGKGKPYKDSSSAEVKPIEKISAPESTLFDDDLPLDDEIEAGEDVIEIENVAQDVEPEVATTPPIQQAAAAGNKRIARITVFYTDGTFEER